MIFSSDTKRRRRVSTTHLTFDYLDPNEDIRSDRDYPCLYPDGTTKRSSVISSLILWPKAVTGGKLPGGCGICRQVTDRINIEVFDRQGNSSGIGTAAFTVDESAERPLEITSITPINAGPGDVVVIEGFGFNNEEPSENRILFQRLARADVLFGSPTTGWKSSYRSAP